MASDQNLQSYQVTPSVNHPLQGDDGSVGGNYPFFQVAQDVEAALRGLSLNTAWRQYNGLTGVAFVRVSNTVFTMGSVDYSDGGAAADYLQWRVGSAVQAFVTAGTIYGTITASTYTGGLTTITVQWDNGAVLDAGFTEARLGVTQADTKGAIPRSVLTQNNSPNFCVVTNGGAGAWAGTLAPPIVAYQTGATYKVKFSGGASVGGDTLNLNGIGAVPITKNGTTPIAAGDIPQNEIAELNYDGANMQLASGLPATVAASLPGFRNLAGQNGGTGTQFTITADLAYLRNPNTGAIVQISALNATVDVGVAGPTANGRDQNAAFPNGSQIHVYAIGGGGQAPALIASLTTPAIGPTLPANYTSFAYAGSFVLAAASTNFQTCYLEGNRVYYQARQSVLSGGASGGEANVSLAAFVPALAQSAQLFVEAQMAKTGAGYVIGNLHIRLVTGVDFAVVNNAFVFPAGSNSAYASDVMDVPTQQLAGQNLIYTFPITTGVASAEANIWVMSYTCPNNS